MPTSTLHIRNLRLLLAILIAAVTTAQPRGAASDVLPVPHTHSSSENCLISGSMPAPVSSLNTFFV